MWYFNYTIYHDKAMQVKIDEWSSFEEASMKQFTRTQDCFFDIILSYGYDPQSNDYSELTSKIDWLAEYDDAGNQATI